MKKLIILWLGIALLASCSSPKYTYYFGKHVYKSVTKEGTGIVTPVDSETQANESESKKLTQPLELNEDVPIYASAEKNSVTSPLKNKITLQSNNSHSLESISKTKLRETKKEIRKEIKKYKKEIRNFAKQADNGKSQLTALLLAILVGALGIHRFYLGYTGAGIIQLLTLGVCGIWSLIDLILIITGDLKPKNGEYTKTL